MNKRIICLFSMMLFASVFSFPVELNNDLSVLPEIDDFIPSENQIVNSKEEPTLINDDDELDDQDISEEEDLAPPSSAGIGKKPAKFSTTIKPNNYHAVINCYNNCSNRAPLYCLKTTTSNIKSLSKSQKQVCSLNCKVATVCSL